VSPVELTHRRGGGGGAKSDDGEKDVYVLLVVFRAFKAPNLRMAKNVEFIKMAGK
jgi:cold shock CspA family protein